MKAPPQPVLSLPSRSVWAADFRPAEPAAFLAALPAEAERARALGAGLLDFPGDLCSLGDEYASPRLWREAARLLRAKGLGATVHLPFAWVDLAALDREVWEGSVRSVETALAATAPLNPLMACAHPGNYASQAVYEGASPPGRETVLTALAGRLAAALARLRDAPGGDALALENLEDTPLELVTRVASTTGVGVCLDVGHVISSGGDPSRAVAAVAGGAANVRLVGLHLHDALPPAPAPPSPASGHSALAAPWPNTPVPATLGQAGAAHGRAHLPLGAGCLDLAGLVADLAATGFAGPVVLEIEGPPADTEASARMFAELANRPDRAGGRRPGRSGQRG